MNKINRTQKVSLLKQLVSIDKVGLWIVFSVAMPFCIGNLNTLKEQLIEWSTASVKAFNAESYDVALSTPELSWGLLLITILGFCIAAGSYAYLQSRYISTWFSQDNTTIDYEPNNSVFGMFRLLSWHIYRAIKVFAPILVMLFLTVALMIVSVKLFNSVITKLMGTNLMFVSVNGIFVALIMAFGWLYAGVLTVWNALKSSFGAITAATEPYVSNHLIYKRARRFAFNYKPTWIVYGLYLAFLAMIGIEIASCLQNPSIISVNNFATILVVQAFNIAAFLFLTRCYVFCYNEAYKIQLKKIHKQNLKKQNRDNSNDNNHLHSNFIASSPF